MSLLPPNATTQETALEQTTARISQIPIKINPLWNPQICPVELLPWLAWALSVDTWDSDWPESTKRQVIADSVAVHRHKGTLSSIRRVLNALGVIVEIEEWFQYQGAPHTFRLTAWVNDQVAIENTPLNPTLYRNLQRTVNQVKPVRSHYDLRVGIALDSTLALGGLSTAVGVSRAKAHLQTPSVNLQPTPLSITSHVFSLAVVRARLQTSN